EVEELRDLASSDRPEGEGQKGERDGNHKHPRRIMESLAARPCFRRRIPKRQEETFEADPFRCALAGRVDLSPSPPTSRRRRDVDASADPRARVPPEGARLRRGPERVCRP